MESGLRDRNNRLLGRPGKHDVDRVSMKSGLRDRNNGPVRRRRDVPRTVSMKSGHGDRNNAALTEDLVLDLMQSQ